MFDQDMERNNAALACSQFFALLSSASNAANEPPSAYLPFCAELDLAAISDNRSGGEKLPSIKRR
jgi:hypothetical protein